MVNSRGCFGSSVLAGSIDLGLAKTPEDLNQEWYTLDPLTAVLYMTFLANRMAERRGLPVVTDDPILQLLLRDFQSDSNEDPDTAFALASLVIETAIPVNLDQISVEQIADFRESFEFERLRFYEALREFSQDLPLVEDGRALRNLLEHKQRLINDAVAALQLSFINARIACVTGLLGLSLPTWSVAARNITGLSAIPAMTMATIAVGIAAQKVIELNKARRDSPWSYVISLRKNLAKEDFLKQLQQGTVLL